MTPTDMAEERKRRKRAQNRMNQRAHRLRGQTAVGQGTQRPYRVDRWRLDDLEYEASRLIRSVVAHEPRGAPGGDQSQRKPEDGEYPVSCGKEVDMIIVRLGFSLPADNLLHVAEYNAFRGFCINKLALGRWARHFAPVGQGTVAIDINGPAFHGHSRVLQVTPGLPTALIPTELQSTRLHSTWIDIIPFPEMRNNLIKWEAYFDHWEFTRDTIGDLLEEERFYRPVGPSEGSISTKLELLERANGNVAREREGLIVWGEPHLTESWEATPGFLRKWIWAVEGCTELIEASNRWRMARGEERIRLATKQA